MNEIKKFELSNEEVKLLQHLIQAVSYKISVR